MIGQKKLGQSLSPASLVSVFIAVLIGILVAVPPYVAANKYYKALKSGDALVLQPATYAKPYDRMRFTFTASNFAQNGLNDRALVVIREGVKLFPNSYEAWSVLAGLPNASAAEITQAKAEMKPGAWLVSLEFEAVELKYTAKTEASPGRPVWLYQAPFTGQSRETRQRQ